METQRERRLLAASKSHYAAGPARRRRVSVPTHPLHAASAHAAMGRGRLAYVRRLLRYYAPRANGESSSYTHQHNFAPPAPAAVAYQPAGSSSSAPVARYDPYATARRPAAAPAPAAASSAAIPPPAPQPGIQFRYSPFFKVERLISAIVECPGMFSSFMYGLLLKAVGQSPQVLWTVGLSPCRSRCRPR